MSGARRKTRVAGEAVQDPQQQEAALQQAAQQLAAQHELRKAAQRGLLKAEALLTKNLKEMKFAETIRDMKIEYIYNPLIYAINPHTNYVNKYFWPKKFLFLGMNPKFNGMAQNGVPFGDGHYVREFMGIQGNLVKPYLHQHPEHLICGLGCKNKEEFGSKFWEHMIEVFGTMENFFLHAYVHIYCPLLFLDKNGKNVRPDKLATSNNRRKLEGLRDDRKELVKHCDECLLSCIKIMKPEVVVAIGVYAEQKVNKVLKNAVLEHRIEVVYMLHPSTATEKAETTLLLQKLLNRGGAVLDPRRQAAQLKFRKAEARLTEQLKVWEVGFIEKIKWNPDTLCKHICNPLTYATIPHTDYVNRYFWPKKVLFLGMNPGPTGTTKNGVPFGDAHYVHEWMEIVKLKNSVLKKFENHPVLNPDCKSPSGIRFWGFMKKEFVTMKNFSRHAYVHNYCPLLFLDEKGKNVVPEDLVKTNLDVLELHCDELLLKILEIMQPEMVVAIGRYAEKRVKKVLERNADLAEGKTVVEMIHPSPKTCKKDYDWAKLASEQLKHVLKVMKQKEETDVVTAEEETDVVTDEDETDVVTGEEGDVVTDEEETDVVTGEVEIEVSNDFEKLKLNVHRY